jgi:hypothetical protein
MVDDGPEVGAAEAALDPVSKLHFGQLFFCGGDNKTAEYYCGFSLLVVPSLAVVYRVPVVVRVAGCFLPGPGINPVMPSL